MMRDMMKGIEKGMIWSETHRFVAALKAAHRKIPVIDLSFTFFT